MRDRFFYPLALTLAAGMILLALVWPQGTGARSPGPFGKPVVGKAASAGLRPSV
jgi:hypothetical protein